VKQVLFIIGFLLTGPSAWLTPVDVHDIHVSLCELKWNEESSAFEVSIKIFIDDLELALGKEGVSGLSIGSAREAANANEEIARYLQQHFKIEIDGVLLAPQFLGKEVSEDFQAIWCYVEFPGHASEGKKCTLSNDILLELYDDQRNIMDIRMSKSHKAYTILQPGRSTWNYTF
jgi:hypothetical protein